MAAGEANVWNPRTLVEVDGDFQSVSQEFTALEGQTAFAITDFVYVPESGALKVYKNGEFLPLTSGFIEAGESGFAVIIACTAGDIVVAVAQVGFSSGTAEAFAGYAEEWAINPEDDPVSVNAGGDDLTTFSALHWAAKAAETFDNFDDIYLGPHAVDPVLDNDGDPLADGMLYTNTTANRLKFYAGAAWNLVPVTASEVINVPAGFIAAINVQDAINELDTEKFDSSDLGVVVQPYDADTPDAIIPQAIAEAGVDTDPYTWTAERFLQALTALGQAAIEYIKISHTVPSGTNGGSTSASTWETVPLTTEDIDTGNNAALAANQITLDAGTYDSDISTPAWHTNKSKLRLQNITDASTELIGSSVTAPATDDTTSPLVIKGRFTIAASKVFEVQQWGSAAVTNTGFGNPTTSGIDEVYAQAIFKKVG